MAKRPSVKEILEAARKGGAAAPPSEPTSEAEPAEASAAPATPSAASPPQTPPANVPTPSQLGRPLTLKEKLAAARAGSAPASVAPAAVEPQAETEAPAARPAAPAAPAPPIGRPLTLQEKLAAARATQGGGAAAAPAAGAKPAASKPAAAAKAAPPARDLPPLDEITDPRDLAEALRRKGAEKAKEAAAKSAPPSKPAAKPAPPKPSTVLPKPSREDAVSRPFASFSAEINRRGFAISSLFVSWIAAAWIAFAATTTAWILMSVRFLFPNVLAEPPTTIKIGLPTRYEPEQVDESYKAEWGFWVVRTTRYDGKDIIFALQSVCTHLGCPPNWLVNEQKFKCPCHGSGFYISGINFEGPAPRPLERFKVALADDGQIVVDKSQKFQEEIHQWSDPDSFIPV